jgi:hypothetical protein
MLRRWREHRLECIEADLVDWETSLSIREETGQRRAALKAEKAIAAVTAKRDRLRTKLDAASSSGRSATDLESEEGRGNG